MKYSFFFFLIFCHLRLSAQYESPDAVQCNLIEAEMKAHEALTRLPGPGFANDYNLTYQRCNWKVDPAVNFISGSVTSYLKASIPAFQTVHFDLSDSLVTDSVLYHSSSISFLHLNNILSITLPAALTLNQADSLCVYYHGVPSTSGFGSFYQGTHAGAPIIWTLSEPYGARDWWPCKQNLVDKIDSLDVFVTCPAGNKAASNGLLVSETLIGSDKLVHWKTTYPIATYLVAIAVTNYVQYSHYIHLTSASDSMEILNYVYPEDIVLAQNSTPQIIKTLALYDSLTVTYPFHQEKYGHAEFGWHGGMEHQTMSFVGGFSNVLISHECAHQWFGDRVTLGSWQDIWLNEGFATYFEALTEERYFPQNWNNWKKNTITDAMRSPNGSVWVDDTTSVGRIFSGSLSYSKGSYLLHMLRWKLGDGMFFSALKSYLNDPLLAYRYARTADLQHHLESVSGQSLGNFFTQWFYGKGFPSYQIMWSQDGQNLTITVNQTQSDPSVPFFEMPIPIAFSGEGHDTTLILNHSWSGQSFTAKIGFTAEFASFDPELHILSGNNTMQSTPVKGGLGASFTLFPNPASNTVQILNLNPSNPVSSIELFSVEGCRIRSEQLTGTQNLNNFDISNVAAGLYELRIRTDMGYVVRKLEIK
ncbi:MAG: M1 family aminopeptidase [Bacteroidia bacterium]